jgi:hypothetical protein
VAWAATLMRCGSVGCGRRSLFEAGLRQADVVAELGGFGADRVTVVPQLAGRGREALAGAERLGRTSRLSDEQLSEVETALLAGPKANGFRLTCGPSLGLPR